MFTIKVQVKCNTAYRPSMQDGEFKIRPDPETGYRILITEYFGYRIPISESDCVKNQTLIHCGPVITRILGSKGLHVTEMEGFC